MSEPVPTPDATPTRDATPTPEATPPPTPQGDWAEGGRVGLLADWITAHRGAFTERALERSAVAAGYTSDEFARALAVTEARPELGPIKFRARLAVLGAYGGVWLAFAGVFLGQQAGSAYVSGEGLQRVLSVALGIALTLSFLVISAGHPDPERPSRALALLLAIPVILLIGVAGLCLPFTGVNG